jgi:hypothetical protein
VIFGEIKSTLDAFFAIPVLTCILIIYTFLDVFTRYIILTSDKLIHRKSLFCVDEINISEITNCFIKTGINKQKKRGYLSLCVKHNKGETDINFFYYSRNDLKQLTQMIGFSCKLK